MIQKVCPSGSFGFHVFGYRLSLVFRVALCRSADDISASSLHRCTVNMLLRACRHLVVPRNEFAFLRKFSGRDAALLEEIKKANERCRGEVEIRLTDSHGWGLFALRDYTTNDKVIVGRSLWSEPEQGMHTIQTDWNKHVFMDLPARFINHVCGTANLGLRDNEHGAYDFHALQDIQAGEELRCDYECTEYQIENFKCECESPLCRRHLKGYRSNGSRVRAVYGEKYIADYLKRE